MASVARHTPERDGARQETDELRDVLHADSDPIIPPGAYRGAEKHRRARGLETKARRFAYRRFEVENRHQASGGRPASSNVLSAMPITLPAGQPFVFPGCSFGSMRS